MPTMLPSDLLPLVEEALQQLWSSLEALTELQPVSVEDVTVHLETLQRHVLEYRTATEALARRAGDPFVPPDTRQGWLDLAEALEGRVLVLDQRHRTRLLELADTLDSGTLRHRLERRTQQLEALRQEAVRDVRQAAEQDPPLALAGPERGADWLAWAWHLQDPELSRVLDSLTDALDSLRRLLVEAGWSEWLGAQALSSPQAQETVFTAMPSSVAPLEAEKGRPVVGQEDEQLTHSHKKVKAGHVPAPAGGSASAPTPLRALSTETSASEMPLAVPPPSASAQSDEAQEQGKRGPEQKTPEQKTPEQKTPEQKTPEQKTPEKAKLEKAAGVLQKPMVVQPTRHLSEADLAPVRPLGGKAARVGSIVPTPLPDMPGSAGIRRLVEARPPSAPATPAVSSLPSALPAAGSPRGSGALPVEITEMPMLEADLVDDFNSPPPPIAKFFQDFYIDPAGTVVPGPWLEPGSNSFSRFVREALPKCFERYLSEPSGPSLLLPYCLELALAAVQAPPWIGASELQQVAALWMDPESTCEPDPARAEWLSQDETLLSDSLSPRIQSCLVLEILRPGGNAAQLVQVSAELLDAAGFKHLPLRQLLEQLLRLLARFQEPARLIRSAREGGSPRTSDQLEQALGKERADYHALVHKLWSAAGGQIRRTHCRKAWDQFMNDNQALLHRFYPEAHGGQPSWNPSEEDRRIRALTKNHEKIADAHQALKDDRKKMDRAVQQIIDAGLRVNAAQRDLQLLTPQSSERKVEIQALLGLVESLSSPLPPDLPPLEVLLIRLLLRSFAPAPADPGPHPLALTARYVFDLPSLVQVFPMRRMDSLSQPWDPAVVVCPDYDFDQSRCCEAAALIVWPGTPIEPEPGVTMFATLNRVMRERKLLSLRLRVAEGLDKEPQDIKEEFDEYGKTLRSLIIVLRETIQELEQLGRPSQDLHELLGKTDQTLYEPLPTDRFFLIESWCRRFYRFASSTSRRMLGAIRTSFEEANDPALMEQATSHVNSGDIAGLRALQLGLRARQPETAGDAGERETLSRVEAEERFPEPGKELERCAADKNGQDKARLDLAMSWFIGLVGDGRKDKKLRNDFVRFLVPEPLLKLKREDSGELALESLHLRKWLDDEGLNPSWLPQLVLFTELIMLVPTSRPTQRSFVQDVGSLARTHEQALCLILAPRLNRELRRECLRELQKRRARAVFVDDLDMLRLFHAQRPLLGLLELALSQQPLQTVSPFETHDGQHVKPEMYVGRRHEVEELVKKPRYSRLFSGRKLGKSALLRFIHHTWDEKPLPSRNILRVLFIQAVGAEKEADLVSRIVDEMKKTLDFKTGGVTHPDDPGDNLVQVMKRFKEANPKTSLLIILDEADTFVESQLSEFDQRQEQCLSFRMRSEIEGDKDSQGLPRVRFVFAGYRVTHRQEGAWANWGEVLRLVPLPPDEATALIRGPLARLGIDASEQALTIADRCGFQPAVILRFGAELLTYLLSRGQTERLVVTSGDALHVYQLPAIQEELRTIARNNFQGNELGKVVFSALLLELSALPPGQTLQSAPARIVDRLMELATRQGVEVKVPETLLNEATVQLALRDMADRELLVITRQKDRETHALKFPHHLPVLVTPQLETALIEDLRRLSQAAPKLEKVHALLTPSSMTNLREAITSARKPELFVQAAVVAGHWQEALTHRAGGVSTRLGILPSSTLQAENGHLREKLEQRERIAILQVGSRQLGELLRQRPDSLPAPLLVGGVDLLREVLRRTHETEDFFELAPLGRLSAPALWWWFYRVRGMEFDSVDAVTRLLNLSSGVPFLMDLLDRILVEQIGVAATVSSAQLKQVEEQFAARLPTHLAGLRTGDSSVRLWDRELELLMIVAEAAQQVDNETDLRRLLTLEWDSRGRPRLNLPGVHPETDRLALQVLIACGLLPVHLRGGSTDPLERLRLPDPSDALLHIAQAFRQGGQAGGSQPFLQER